MKFPAIVYRSPGAHFGPPVAGKSTTYDYVGVNDEAGLKAALAAGYFLTLDEAVDPSKRAPVAPVAEPEAPHLVDVSGEDSDTKVVDLKTLDRADLKAIAKDLPGYDGRMGKDELVALIEKAKG